MSDAYKTAYRTLHVIYDKHRRKYHGNSDTKQMCCMWSVKNPPDTLLDTQPIYDIEDAFNINIDEDEVMELYDMTLEEAVMKIKSIQEEMI